MRLGLGLGLVRLGRAAASFVRNGLKLYYPFKDNSPDFLLDGSTSFDGVDDYIEVADADNLSFGDGTNDSAFSFSCWVKADDLTAQVFLSKGVYNTDGEYLFGTTSVDKLDLFLMDESGASTYQRVQSPAITSYEGQWIHVVATYDGRGGTSANDGMKLYLNGVSQTVTKLSNGTYVAMENLGGNVEIGFYNTTYSKQLMANVGIWNRELSASEVESIYWRGSHSELQNTELTNLVSWYNLSSTGLGAEVISNGTMETVSTNTLLPNYESFPEDWTSSYGTLSIQERSSAQAFAGTHSLRFKTNASSRSGVVQTLSVTGSASYRLEFYVYGVTGSTIQITHQTGIGTSSTLDGGGTLLDYEQSVTIGEWKQITFDFTTTGSGTVTGTVLQLGSNVSGNEYYIDNVSLKPIGVSTPDSQGSNDGTIEGATVNTDLYSGESPFKPRIQDKATPKMAVQLADGSTSFDGTDDYIDLGASLISTNHTISAWVYRDSSGTNDVDYLIGMRDGIDDGFIIFSRSETSISSKVQTSELQYNSFTSDEWHHVASTYDGSTQRLYIDGSEVLNASISDTISVTANSLIGKDSISGGANYWNGKIANVAIYSSALTQTQIQELMFTEKYSGLSADLKTNLVSWYDLGSTELGTSLITGANSDFSSDSGFWSLIPGSGTATIADGTLNFNSVQNGYGVKRVGLVTTGKSYRATFTISDYSAGSIKVYGNGVYSDTAIDSNGTHSLDFVAGSTNTDFWIVAIGTTTLKIDNFLLQEVQVEDLEGSNTGTVYGATTNTGYTHSPHGVVDPLNFGEVYSGRALSFDGSNDDATIGDIGATMYAMSFWFESNADISASSGLGHPICLTDDHSYGGIYFGGFTGSLTNEVISIVSNTASKINYYTSATDVIPDDMWHHLGITWDSSNSKYKIYLDGNELPVTESGGTISPIVCDYVMLGKRYSGHHLYAGKLNNIKIFNTALTESQLRELYTKPETVLPTGVSASNLKLDLPMQEGSGSYIYDGSGNQNHGTITGATWATGEEYGYQASLVRSNTPMIFDGSNDYVDTGISPRALVGSSSAFTVSAWINAQDDDNDYIVGAMESGAERFYFRVFDVSGTGYIRWGYGDTASSDTDAPINLNEWHHVVWTYDTTNAKVYIDGVLKNTTAVSGKTITNTDNLYIGALNNNGSTANYFNGLINEVAMWDVALDADAISALYGSGTPLLPTSDSGNYDNSDSLVGYWRNDSNTTWTDRANTGVASFDSTDDYLDCGVVTDYSSASGSIATWIKVKDNASPSLQGIVTNGSTGTDSHYVGISSNKVRYTTSNSSIGYTIFSDSDVSENQWVHAVATRSYDGVNTTTKLYIDGVLQTDSDTYTGTQEANSSNILIGHLNVSRFFNGQISGTHIFNVALSASEVSELYAIDKRSSISGFSQFSNCTASWLMGADENDTSSTIQDQTSNNHDATVNGAGLVGYNDGTASGSPVEIVIPEGSTEGRDNQGYYLSDTTTISNGIRLFEGEYIEVDDSEVLQNIFDGGGSVEVWIYAKGWGESDTGRIITKCGSGNSNGWNIFIENGGRLYLRSDWSTTDMVRYATSAINLNQWHHIAITYNSTASAGTDPIIYVDGVSKTLSGTASAGTVVSDAGQKIRIGARGTGLDREFDGLIDEVRLYDKILSADEVSKNYTNGLGKHS